MATTQNALRIKDNPNAALIGYTDEDFGIDVRAARSGDDTPSMVKQGAASPVTASVIETRIQARAACEIHAPWEGLA